MSIYKILYTVLNFFFFSWNGFSITKDTIPPVGKLVSPEPYTVITGNAIRLSAVAQDSESGVKTVHFYACYYNWLDTNLFCHRELIAKVASAPYEVIWNVFHIPDQSYLKMSFFCNIEDSAGNLREYAGNIVRGVVLDRNPELKATTLASSFAAKPMIIDGHADEWEPDLDWKDFTNNDNHIRFTSLWDDTYLYFFVKVMDKSIFYTQTPEKTMSPVFNHREIWQYDEVEFFFDINHNHSPLNERNDLHTLVGAGGASYSFFVRNPQQHVFELKVDSSIQYKVFTSDTLYSVNYYCLEIAFPWTYLESKPKSNLSIGFDLFNQDVDNSCGKRVGLSWGGCERFNQENPSEWGNLVLKREFYNMPVFKFLFIIPGAVLIALFLRYNLRVPRTRDKINLSREEQIVEKTEKYLRENYSDPSLNRGKVADYLSISSVYLGKIFKKNARRSLPAYWNELRISQAEDLLKNTEKKITDITFEVGFSSLEHFIKTFKVQKGVSPNEFRKKLR